MNNILEQASLTCADGCKLL